VRTTSMACRTGRSDKSGKGAQTAPVAPADNVLMHAIYYSDLNAQSGQWSERKPIYIEGIIDGNAVDPDIRAVAGRPLSADLHARASSGRPIPNRSRPSTAHGPMTACTSLIPMQSSSRVLAAATGFPW
jgi:hypothetical protein